MFPSLSSPSLPLSLLSTLALIPASSAWLPTSPPQGVDLSAFAKGVTSKIRGVNLGSQFIIEPWMARNEWAKMGCGDAQAEFQCIQNQFKGDIDAASKVWKEHWGRWITTSDLDKMVSYGLNTIRVPVGWWMKEDLVQKGEYFPKGGFSYLENLCDHAASNGMYVIIEMHAAPGTQNAQQPFTGNYSDKPYFYQSDYQSGRAYSFLSWLTTKIHTSNAFRTVGAIGILNEPKFNTIDGDTKWMVEHYYGSAIDAVRKAESSSGVASTSSPKSLHITLMDDLWGSGASDPASSLSAAQKQNLLFDDHNYEQDPVAGKDQAGVIAYACGDDRGTALQPHDAKFVGEWSMAVHQTGAGFTPETDNRAFWSQYFSAQQWQYERTRGWTWWSWKAEGGSQLENWLQWSYSGAVENGLISKNLNAQLAANPCSKSKNK